MKNCCYYTLLILIYYNINFVILIYEYYLIYDPSGKVLQWFPAATLTNVTLDHKTSHKGQFFEIEMYTSSESWINNLSIGVWFCYDRTIFVNLESEGAKKSKYWENHL